MTEFDEENEIDDFDDDDDGELPFDCHMGPDGLCGAAGSEDCDFECPYRSDYEKQRKANA